MKPVFREQISGSKELGARSRGRYQAIGLLSLLLATLMPVPAEAASGIVISPPLQEVTIQAAQPKVPASFTLTNNTGRDQRILLSTIDFNALDETGGVAFVGQNPTELQRKYGLARWLSVPGEVVLGKG